jgi:glycosyltransferase involved in cell wall biosynthesis
MSQLPGDVTAELATGPSEAVIAADVITAYCLEDRIDLKGNHAAGRARICKDGEALDVNATDFLGTVIADVGGGMAESTAGGLERLAGHRIAVVTNGPTHYRLPLWNALHARLERVGAEIIFLFSSRDPRQARPWLTLAPMVFEHRQLRAFPVPGGLDAPADLERELKRLQPTIVVAAGFAPQVTGRAALFASRRGIPLVLWSGETRRRADQRSRLVRRTRERMVRSATSAIAYGWRSAEMLKELRPDLPLVLGRNTTLVPGSRSESDTSGVTRVLTVARAIPGKGLDVAIAAMKLLTNYPIELTVVGDGPELGALRSGAAGLSNVRFEGAVGTDEILSMYRRADVFLFLSRIDVFGLVLVEALGAGLATVCTATTGAAGDLAVDGQNCVVLETADAASVARTLKKLAAAGDLRRALGQEASRTIANRWTVEHSVESWIAGLVLSTLRHERIQTSR